MNTSKNNRLVSNIHAATFVCKLHHDNLFLISLLLFVVFSLSGCAKQPWSDPLEDDGFDEALTIFTNKVERDGSCGKTLEADLALFYNNPFEEKAIRGFFQFSHPLAYKFVTTNPLGQPIVVVAGNQKTFQAITTYNKRYLAGSLRSYAIRNKLPLQLLESDWAALVFARAYGKKESVKAISRDRDGRGIWFTTTDDKAHTKGKTHLLIDPETGKLISRSLENGKGKIIATVNYSNWLEIGACYQPREIVVDGLDYGASIRLQLSAVSLLEAGEKYTLPVPAGYLQQYMP